VVIVPYIGPDTVDLVIRDPAAGVDEHGRPNRVDRIVPKGNSCVTVTQTVEKRDDGTPVTMYLAKAALPADADTSALTVLDAIAHDGRTYELNAGAVVKRTLRGAADHVRVYGSHEEPIAETREQVTITPRFGRDDEGQHLPDGAPFTVFARAVEVGNTAARYGARTSVDEVDFTVTFDLDTAIKNGDAIDVRGRRGYARVETDLEQWADRSQLVVYVRSVIGGGR
jgi:hypothetical protein